MLEHIPPLITQYIRHNARNVALIDPADGKPINSKAVAAFIMDTGYYRKGIECLKQYGPNCSIDIQFGTHIDAESFGGLRAMHRAITAHDIFIPEQLYWDQQAVADFNEVAARDNITSLADVEQYRYEGVHVNNLLQALAGTHVVVRMIDMNETDLKRSSQLQRCDHFWRTQRAAGRNADPEALIIMMTIIFYYREWIMLANLGYVLHEYATSHPQNAEGKILISIGAMHYNLVEKLQTVGVGCTAMHPFLSDATWQTIRRRAELMHAYKYGEADIKEMIALFS